MIRSPSHSVLVAAGPRRRRVERLVRVELVDEQHPPTVGLVPSGVGHPLRGRLHGLRPGEVVLGAEVGAGTVVGAIELGRVLTEPALQPPAAVLGRRCRHADPAGVEPRLPRIALVPAHVVPAAEVRVVVLAAALEQVRVIGDEHRRHARVAQVGRDRLFPQLDRAPRSPQEVECAAQDVVPRRHARQRAGDMAGEPGAARGEPIEVGRQELGAAVTPEEVSVERIEQHDDDVVGHLALVPLVPHRHNLPHGAQRSGDGAHDRADRCAA
jgi:hypothetical protein